MNEYVRRFIDNEPIPGIDAEYAIMNQIAPNIPVETINSFIPSLVNDSNIVVNIFCPEKGMKISYRTRNYGCAQQSEKQRNSLRMKIRYLMNHW